MLEVISQIPEQDDDAAELDEAEEVGRVILVARHQPAEVLEPREESLHLPASPVAAQGTAVLRAVGGGWRDAGR